MSLTRHDVTLSGKAMLITGAASGIGAACVRRAAARGARILFCDIDEAAGMSLAAELSGEGFECEFRPVDVTVERDVAAAVDLAVSRFGQLDVAVNNAGITGSAGSIENTDLETWQRVIAVNLTAVFLCVKHELRVMKPRRSGAIVNVASGAALIGTPNMVAYCASKHGVLGVMRTAVAENPAGGIRINSVLPGSTKTPMVEQAMAASADVEAMVMASVPCGRLAEPDEIAEAILWLCSDAASYVNGASLVVDGGTLNR